MSKGQTMGRWVLAAGQKIAVAMSMIATYAHADSLIDPTRPPVVAHKSSPAAPVVIAMPRVTAIFQSGDRRVAVLDGQVVKAGDRIGDVYIETVTADGVRYRRSGKVEYVRLPSQAASVRRKVDSEENEP